MKLAQRTIKGVIWAYIVFFSGRLVTLATTAILARLLIPADFGLVGFALLWLNFVEATQDFGVKDALIYNDERVQDTADTAFWLNVTIGTLQYSIAFLVAPLALHFIDDARIVTMLRVMSLTFIINAIGNTHDGLLQKSLAFRRRYLPTLYSSFIKGVVSVVLALMGAGVWSLVAGHVIGAGVRTVAKWLLLDWRPRLRFFTDRARALWRYGMYILIFNVLGIALDQADQMMIGFLLGEIQLGYYTIAARIPEMVIANFSLVLTRILFPTYTKLKNDPERLTQGFLATTKYTAFITVPAGFGMAAVAPELVRVFFGDQWEPAINLLRVLAFMGMVMTLPWSVGDVFKAVGRPDLSTKLLAIESAYSFPLIWAFAFHWREAVMVSFGNLLAVIITAFLRLGLVTRYLKLSVWEFVSIFRAPFIAGGTMFGIIMLWREVTASLPALIVLVTSMLIGAAVYAGLLLLMEKDDIIDKRDFLLDMLRSRGKSDDDEDEATLPVSHEPSQAEV